MANVVLLVVLLVQVHQSKEVQGKVVALLQVVRHRKQLGVHGLVGDQRFPKLIHHDGDDLQAASKIHGRSSLGKLGRIFS